MLSTLRNTTFELSADAISSMCACRRCGLNFDVNRAPLQLTCSCVICSQCARKLLQLQVVQAASGRIRHCWTIMCDADQRSACTGNKTIVAGGNVGTMRIATHVQEMIAILRAAARVGGSPADYLEHDAYSESQFVTITVNDMAGNPLHIVVNINVTVAQLKDMLRDAVVRRCGRRDAGSKYLPHLTVLFRPMTDTSNQVSLNDNARTLASFGITDNCTIIAVVNDGFGGGEVVDCFTPGRVSPSHIDQNSMRATRGLVFSRFCHFLFVCDMFNKSFPGGPKQPCVWQLNALSGEVVHKFDGCFGRDNLPMINPSCICLSPCGVLIYVTDSENRRVLAFDVNTHSLVFAVSSPAFGNLSGMCASPDGQYLFAACESTDRLMVVRLNGQYSRIVCFIGGRGEAMGQFNRPAGVSMSSDGSLLLVADSMNHRVQVLHVPRAVDLGDLSAAFSVKCVLGKGGSGPGEFHGIMDVKMSPDDNLVYVADYGHSVVQVLCAHCGSHVHTIGGNYTASEDVRIVCPYGIALGQRADQEVLVVSDYHDGRIRTFTVPPSTGVGVVLAVGDANAPIAILE